MRYPCETIVLRDDMIRLCVDRGETHAVTRDAAATMTMSDNSRSCLSAPRSSCFHSAIGPLRDPLHLPTLNFLIMSSKGFSALVGRALRETGAALKRSGEAEVSGTPQDQFGCIRSGGGGWEAGLDGCFTIHFVPQLISQFSKIAIYSRFLSDIGQR